MLDWNVYLERHESRRRCALAAAAEGLGAVADAVIAAFSLHPSARPALARALEARAFTPHPRAVSGLLLPAERLPPPPFAEATDLAFRDWLCRQAPPWDGPPPPPLAWVCAALLGHAADHEDLHRAAWGAVAYPAHPRDEPTVTVVRRVQGGDLWGVMKPLKALTWPPTKAIFEAGFKALRLPPEVSRPALERAEEGWPFLVVAGCGDAGPVLDEILARAVETLGGARGPVAPIARLVDRPAWEALAAELVTGRWRGPLSQLYRAPRGPRSRAVAVGRRWAEAADRFEADMLAALLLRLLARWSRHPESLLPSAAWRRLEASYNRGRARLRAAAAARRPDLCAALLTAPAPYAHLLAGVRRYALAHFWKQAHWNFPGDGSAAPRPPEPALEEDLNLWPDAATQGAVRAWVLLAVLRGDGALVAAWRDRSVGRVGGTWDRRQEELKEALGAPPDHPGEDLRARLSLALFAEPELLGPHGEPGPDLVPFLARVAALDEGNRKTIARIREILREAAGPGQAPEPGGGSPGMVREARRWTPWAGPEST